VATITTGSLVALGIPAGTSLKVFDGGDHPAGRGRPAARTDTSNGIASATTDAAGALTVTNAGIVQGREYVLWASGARYVRVRSTLDVHDRAQTVASAVTTTNGADALTAIAVTSGRLEPGQRITAVGLKPGTMVRDVLTASSVRMTEVATASGTVAATFDGSLATGALRERRMAEAGAI
jgi:hypothetical protein